ncbi:MAG TPA: FAD-binding oxidoreductase [Polyangiaceae bacterium]|nr:FAD-binding oxidoreductase [Polyangiaceae bacterium]
MSEEIRISFEGRSYLLEEGESVLDCLLRNRESLDSYCRSGVCQSCVVKARPHSRDAVPARAQVGLKEAAKRAGLMLACVCRPTQPLELERAEALPRYATRIHDVRPLSPSVLRVELEVPSGFEYQAGQFIQLERPQDGLMRPYSLASLPSDPCLELHVARLENGAMSGWLESAVGQPVTIKGPLGECSYFDGEPERPLLLAGTGTGLAPLLGVIRAAARARHQGPITLLHGARDAAGIYHAEKLARLRAAIPNLRVLAVALEGPLPSDPGLEWRSGALDQQLFSEYAQLDEHRLYFCGNPELVGRLKKRAYLAGASLARIHSDPFLAPTQAPQARS